MLVESENSLFPIKLIFLIFASNPSFISNTRLILFCPKFIILASINVEKNLNLL